MVLPLLPSLAAVLLVGCTPPAPKPMAAPAPVAATPEQTVQVQAALAKIIPGSLVGKVAAVKGNLAAVTGIPFASVVAPKSIQFLDGNSMTIANGLVSTASDPASPYLVVEFTPAPGGRAPIENDTAVYLPPR